MRVACSLLVAALAACGGSVQPVELALDVPTGMLAPAQVATVQVTLRDQDGNETFRSATVSDGRFELGAIDIGETAFVEARLQTIGGRIAGYGRSAQLETFASSGRVEIPVRAPIGYLATARSEYDGDDATPDPWQARSALFGSFAATGTLANLAAANGLATQAPLFTNAGGDLFAFEQALGSDGQGTGAVTLRAVDSGNHSLGASAPLATTGAIRDAAGSDDGKWLALATNTGAWRIDVTTNQAVQVADFAVDRIAISADGGELLVLGARVGAATNCTNVARLKRITMAAPERDMTLMGAYSDVSYADHKFYFSNICTGEISRIVGDQAEVIRKTQARPDNLVASASRVWYSHLDASAFRISAFDLASNAAPVTLWGMPATVTLTTTRLPGIARTLVAHTAAIAHLRLIADEYLAVNMGMEFTDIPDINVSDLEVQAERTMVLSAQDGGVVQRYDHWCAVQERCIGYCNWTCTPPDDVTTETNGLRVKSIAGTWSRP